MSPPGGDPDPETLAHLHALAFDAPWSTRAFADLLASPGVFAVHDPEGFILCRVVADEAEILTLAVAPRARRSGLGTRLTRDAATLAAAAGAERLFLEVAEDNIAAKALYDGLGFRQAGRRRGYYARADGATVDALLLVLKFGRRLSSG